MIVKEDFLNEIRQYFSLNLYEAKIWTALLSRGVSTAGELSEISRVPRSRAYDILESLETKGFIIMKLGKPIKYLAIEPDEVLERTKVLIQKDAEGYVKKLDDIKKGEVFNELKILHKEGIDFIEPADLSGALRGRQNLYTHLNTLLKGATQTVNLVTSPEGLARKWDSLKNTFKLLKKKGVKVKIAAPLTGDLKHVLKELVKYAEIRDLKKLNSRFCIVDNKELMFMLMDDKEVHSSYDIGIWVNTPFFASSMNNMFNLVWKDLNKAKMP
ncbi:MAG: helix-turn-helix domain-containing protein [Nanoarchaeota archaeon]|nr:helix-turn-helix domain-containing protein [Nanoarchaeota archaeon]